MKDEPREARTSQESTPSEAAETPTDRADEVTLTVEELHTIERRGRWEGFAFLGAILAVVLVLAGSLFGTLRENFAPERLRASALVEARALAPIVVERAGSMARDLAPVYLEAAKQGVVEALPQLRERVQHEATVLGEIVANRARSRFEQAMTRALEETIRRMQRRFPALADDRFVENLLASTSSHLHGEMRTLLTETVEAYTQPAIDLLLAADRLPRLPKVSDATLRRRYLQLWLELLQIELAEGASTPRGEKVAHAATAGRTGRER